MSTRPRREIAAVISAAVAVLLVVTAMGAAVAVPERSELADTTRAAALDYGALEGTVSPLSADFIARTLGRPPVRDGAGEAIAPPAEAPNAPSNGAGPPVLASPVVMGGLSAAPTSGPATNDDIAAAQPVEGLPFRHTVPASGGTRETADPGECLPAGGTWWYRWTPDVDQLAVLTTTPSLIAPTTIGVFTGSDPHDLQAIDCRTGVTGTRLPFTARAGQTHWVQVTVPIGLPGEVDVALVALGPIRALIGPAAGELRPGGSHCRTCPATEPSFIHLSLSADGRTAAGLTTRGLDPRDTNGVTDVYAVDIPTGEVTLVTASHDGLRAADHPHGARLPTISHDGRWVAFASGAADLLPDGVDTNGGVDTFIHDLQTGRVERVSVRSDGREGRQPEVSAGAALEDSDGLLQAHWVDLSADGRFVVFETDLQLHGDDRDRMVSPHPDVLGEPQIPGIQGDVYLHDRQTRQTRLLGRDEQGDVPDPWFNTWNPVISGDGSTVVFFTDAPLTVEDTDGQLFDFYARDLVTGSLRLVSPSTHGEDTRNHATSFGLSGDGRWLTFTSAAAGLVPGDSNEIVDVFRADLHTGDIIRVSEGTGGVQQQRPDDADCAVGPGLPTVVLVAVRTAPGHACRVMASADMSIDGRYVAFSSNGLNLSPDDTTRPASGATGAPGEIVDRDVYLHDTLMGITTLLSTAADGRTAQGGSPVAAISGDGRTVLMASHADLAGDGAPHPNSDPGGAAYRGPGIGVYVRDLPR